MGKGLIAVVVVLAVLLLVVLIFFGQYVGVKNTLVQKNEAVKAAWSQVDIVLQRRADLPRGTIGLAVGLPGSPWFTAGASVKLRRGSDA